MSQQFELGGQLREGLTHLHNLYGVGPFAGYVAVTNVYELHSSARAALPSLCSHLPEIRSCILESVSVAGK